MWRGEFLLLDLFSSALLLLPELVDGNRALNPVEAVGGDRAAVEENVANVPEGRAVVATAQSPSSSA